MNGVVLYFCEVFVVAFGGGNNFKRSSVRRWFTEKSVVFNLT